MSSVSPPPRTPSADNPHAERVRSLLELADAAAIAHRRFRLVVDDACLKPEFRDIPFSDENVGAVLNRVGGFVSDRKRVLDAVFHDHPEEVAPACCLVLADAFQRRGIHSPEMMQTARRFIQSFTDLRDLRSWPGVNLPGDGWDGWRESYALDGRHLAAYVKHRNGILAPLNVHEVGIIGRQRYFTVRTGKWPRKYTTDNLIRMAKTAHRVLSSPATDVPKTPPGPPAEAPPDPPPAAPFPHYGDYSPPGSANSPEAVWPQAQRRRDAFVCGVAVANDRLAVAGARLPDALTTYWTRQWADGFWRATQHARPSLEGVRALIDFGDVVHAEFRLNGGRGTKPRDVEFTYYDRVPRRGNFPIPLGTHAKTLERDDRVSPIPFPRLAAPVPGLAPRIRCEEFLAWGGFLAGDVLPTEAQWADLNRVGVDAVGERGGDTVGWCVADGGDVTECQRIANNLVVQLRRQTDAVAEECGIDYALTSESCDLFDVLRTVKQWLRRLQTPLNSVSAPLPVTCNTKGKNIDARMLKVFAERPESHGWTARQWAEHLGCAHSTIVGTNTWNDRLKAIRAMNAADAAKRMEKKPARRGGKRRG